MNVFYTNECPIQAANEHCLVHQRKMLVEYCQILSVAHYVLDGKVVGYKPTHHNHPSAVWIRQSKAHYEWVWLCAMRLSELYTQNTGKVHKSTDVLALLVDPPKNISNNPFREPPVAAPDEFKAVAIFKGAAVAYQKYLNTKFKEWLDRERPVAVEFMYSPNWLSI